MGAETLLKTDKVTLAVEALKDGKFLVCSTSWDQNKTVLPGQAVDLCWRTAKWCSATPSARWVWRCMRTSALGARYWYLWVRCPACRTTQSIDLRRLDRHRDAAVTSLV